MEHKQLLIQKKQELVALETTFQQLPKEGSGGTIGLVITVLGIIIFLATGGSEVGLAGIIAFIIGIIWWISGTISKSNKRKAIEEINSKILKLKNEIIEIENS